MRLDPYLAKLVLEVLAREKSLHWAKLQQRVLSAYQSDVSVTFSRFCRCMLHLRKLGWVERKSVGVYAISECGKKFLESVHGDAQER